MLLSQLQSSDLVSLERDLKGEFPFVEAIHVQHALMWIK